MKILNLALILSLFLISFIGNAQSSTPSFSLTIYAEDAVGVTDSVILGFNELASLGLDSALEEVNIYGQGFDDLDLRIIQRDSTNHNCLFESNSTGNLGDHLYYAENMESKKNFRNEGMEFSIHNNFEMLLHSKNPPVKLSAYFFDALGNSAYFSGSMITLKNINCDLIQSQKIFNVDEDSIFTISDSILTLVLELFTDLSAGSIQNSKRITFYPNPATEHICFNLPENNDEGVLVNIFSINGRVLKSYIVNGNQGEHILDVAELIPGVYIIDFQGEVRFRDKFIKL